MAAPADALANMPDQGAAPAQADSAAQPQANAAPKTGLWHRVLEGALAGLQTGRGAIVGAADPNTAIAAKQNMQQMAAAKVKFANAQAASLIAQEHARQRMLDQTDKQIATQASAVDEKFMKDIMDHGGVPSVVTSDGSDAAHVAGLQQASENSPNGVPEQLHLKLPSGQTVAFNMADLGTNQAVVHRINLYQAATGNPMTDAATLNNPKITAPAYKTQLMQKARDFFNPIPAGNTPEAKAQSLDTLRQSYHNYLAQVQTLKDSDPNKGELVSLLGDAVKRLEAWPTPKAETAPGKAVPGRLNGQPAFARDAGPGKGFVDVKTGEPMPGFLPAPSYADVAANVANLRNQTVTKEVLKPDGIHIMAYDPATKNFTRDQGLAGTGAQGNRGAAASSSVRMGEDLIADLRANKDRLGGLNAWVQKYGLNTPVADPKLAKIQSELSSFAALQPVQHGFRSTDALHTFEAIIGGLQKNPEATIASIQGLIKTSGAINPTIRPEPGHKTAAPAAKAAPQQAPPAGNKAAQFGQTF